LEEIEWATLIIRQAHSDWKKAGRFKKRPKNPGKHVAALFDLAEEIGFETPRDELLAFFRSEWFDELCQLLGMDAPIIRDGILGKVRGRVLIRAGGKLFSIHTP